MSTGFKLRNGTILLSTEAPGGIYNAAQLKKIASLCEGEVAIVKATEDQRLALCVKPEQAATIAKELKSIGLGIRHYQDGLHHPTSCIGELCPDHEQDALGSALDISQQLEAIKLSSPLKIGINGCARCCVPCHTLDISVVGDASGYRMHLGGKNSQLPEMASFMAEGIPPGELPGLILKVIALYQQHAEPTESLQEVIERVGSAEFISILAPYSQDAAGDADPFSSSSANEPELLSDSDEEPSMIDEPLMEELAPDEEEIQDLDLAPEVMAGDVTDFELADDDLSASASELSLAESSTAESESGLSLVENDELSMESMDDVDLSPASEANSFGGDINPNSDSMADFAGEVAISSDGNAAHDISLSDDFGEDDIDASPASADANFTATDIDLDSLPEAELIDSDMSESTIDVSDVMKSAPLAVSPAATATELNIADAGDLNLDDADLPVDEAAYEQQLTASIAAQEQLVDQSHSDEEREQALDLLSDSETSLDDTNEDNDIADEGFAGSGIEEISEDLATNAEDSDEFEEFESTDPHDHLPLSEVVGTAVKPVAPTLLRGQNSFETSPPAKKSTGTWSFSGFDIDANANPVISFANGVQITLTEEAIANGSVTIGGHNISLASINGGIEIKMDGMKMFLPKAA